MAGVPAWGRINMPRHRVPVEVVHEEEGGRCICRARAGRGGERLWSLVAGHAHPGARADGKIVSSPRPMASPRTNPK